MYCAYIRPSKPRSTSEVCIVYAPRLRLGAYTLQTSSDLSSRVVYTRNTLLNHDLYSTRRIKRFPAKTFTNVGMVQRVIKNRVRAPTHHIGNKSPDTRRGSLASLAIHNPCRSRFIAFKRLCIHCTQVNILRLQVTLKPLSPSLHLATCVVKVACMNSYALKQRWCTQICK